MSQSTLLQSDVSTPEGLVWRTSIGLAEVQCDKRDALSEIRR
jgi:hypothetical protein